MFSKFLQMDCPIRTIAKGNKKVIDHNSIESYLYNEIAEEFVPVIKLECAHAQLGYVIFTCEIRNENANRQCIGVGEADVADLAAIRAFDRAAAAYLGLEIESVVSEPTPVAEPAPEPEETPAPAPAPVDDGINTVLTKGKFAGKTYLQVAKENEKYARWCLENFKQEDQKRLWASALEAAK